MLLKLLAITCLLLSVAYAPPPDHNYGPPSNGFLNGYNKDQYGLPYKQYIPPQEPPARKGDYGKEFQGVKIFGPGVKQAHDKWNYDRKGKAVVVG